MRFFFVVVVVVVFFFFFFKKKVLVRLVTRSFDFVPDAFPKNCSAVDLFASI